MSGRAPESHGELRTAHRRQVYISLQPNPLAAADLHQRREEVQLSSHRDQREGGCVVLQGDGWQGRVGRHPAQPMWAKLPAPNRTVPLAPAGATGIPLSVPHLHHSPAPAGHLLDDQVVPAGLVLQAEEAQ